jgi:hypothetical protein
VTGRLLNRVRRRRTIVIAAVLAAVVVVALAIVAWPQTSTSGGPYVITGPAAVTAERNQQLDQLLAARGSAVVRHDKTAFMATVDPRDAAFRRSQARMFADLGAVHFTSWSYDMTRTARRPPSDAATYDAPVWAPSYFTLNYRLAHFDKRPTNLRQYPTFVERRGRWYLGSLSDFASRGLVSATDLWDYGPVSVVRRSDVLVLGSPRQRATMLDVARDIQTAIPQVTSVWGRDWPRRAVVLVPRTMHEMALIDDDHADLRQIAALTSAEVTTTPGKPSPVGDRITVNPRNWPLLSPIGAQVVLRHELTHVATEAATGTRTPTWLSEGFADYVGFAFADVPVTAGAAELQHQVESGDLPSRLPSDRGFRGSDHALALHYEAAWFACRTIARRFGQAALVRFYRAVGRSTDSSTVAVRDALSSVLHLRLARFVELWRADLRTELA